MQRRILIGGASLAGKSSLAAELSSELGWEVVSTDFLARHPGRPWRDDGSQVPPHVVEHFVSLSPEELLEDVLRHYRSLAPRIRELADGDAASDGGREGLSHVRGQAGGEVQGRIIEGSAVLPELAFELRSAPCCCFLLAKPGALSQRILRHAGAENEAAKKFAARAELMNDFIAAEAGRLELPTFDADVVSADSILSSL